MKLVNQTIQNCFPAKHAVSAKFAKVLQGFYTTIRLLNFE